MTAPAGWYSNPDGSPGSRCWDGHQWAPHNPPSATGLTHGSHDSPSFGRSEPQQWPQSPAGGWAANTNAVSGADSLDRGTSRWIVGLAALIVAGVLGLTAFTEWGHITYAASDGQSGQLTVSAALSRFGTVSVTVPGISNSTERRRVEAADEEALSAAEPKPPGWPVLVVAALLAGSAAAYLRTRHRTAAASVIIVLSTLGLMNGLWRITNVRGMFNDPAAYDSASYSPGFGLVAATVVALALVGLGVTALVLERRAPMRAPRPPYPPNRGRH